MTRDNNGRAHRPAGSPAATGGQFAREAAPQQASKLPPRRTPEEKAARAARMALSTAQAATSLAGALRELEPKLAERSSGIHFRIADGKIDDTLADVWHERAIVDTLNKHRVAEHAAGLQFIQTLDRTPSGGYSIRLNEAADLDWQAERAEQRAREQAALADVDTALEVLDELGD